jgi:hypothetical protein
MLVLQCENDGGRALHAGEHYALATVHCQEDPLVELAPPERFTTLCRRNKMWAGAA